MLCWNVYISDFNSGLIKTYNIFNHAAFYDACVTAKRKHKDDAAGFAEEVRLNLSYYFWSKCEWEIVLQHWPSGEVSRMRRNVTCGELANAMEHIGKGYSEEELWGAVADREMIVEVFPAKTRFRDEKIDVYDQVMKNWDVFIRYLWNNRTELKARKRA